ncbi:hypothetical protein EXU48_05390 [Occultella glacieicola]|uniref:Uncharacterized protein n=1 Tax=Occultella glacieicola TaxID=2518684 RepID=A0ABY2E7S2_9MICO|nr:hypothetical protein [Occultella glacieicola]TDE97610.1 hypothetical protein EXU48_05390 [Occultella glacieicola]
MGPLDRLRRAGLPGERPPSGIKDEAVRRQGAVKPAAVTVPGAQRQQVEHVDEGLSVRSDRRGVTLVPEPTGVGTFRRVVLRRQ